MCPSQAQLGQGHGLYSPKINFNPFKLHISTKAQNTTWTKILLLF